MIHLEAGTKFFFLSWTLVSLCFLIHLVGHEMNEYTQVVHDQMSGFVHLDSQWLTLRASNSTVLIARFAAMRDHGDQNSNHKDHN